jgi:hypothetical protein
MIQAKKEEVVGRWENYPRRSFTLLTPSNIIRVIKTCKMGET